MKSKISARKVTKPVVKTKASAKKKPTRSNRNTVASGRTPGSAGEPAGQLRAPTLTEDPIPGAPASQADTSEPVPSMDPKGFLSRGSKSRK